MRIKEMFKKISPSYKVEKHLAKRLDEIDRHIKESNEKNEYLFWLSQMQPGETMQQTKERVFLMMPKATGRLRNIQLAENYILQRVKQICDMNGLEMFLVGGTLLGAVRHKGFIPWDNDVDIGMMKSDYLALREILSNDPELSLEYYYNYEAGLRMSKVKLRKADVFWIDILTFDTIDTDQREISETWNTTKEINRKFCLRVCEKAEPWRASYPQRPVANAELDSAVADLVSDMENSFPLMGRGEYFCCTLDMPYWARDPRGIKLCKTHFPLQKNAVEFEGVLYDAWNHYDEALCYMYGDYWNLPLSVGEPHSAELTDGLENGFAFLRRKGIIPLEEV